jgi:hypothetical protein
MFRSFAVVAVVTLACSRTPAESLGRDVAKVSSNSPAAPSTRAGQDQALSSAAVASAAVPPAATSAISDVTPPSPAASYRFPSAERIVAIGDLHGDLASARLALKAAGAIDDEDRWVGGKLVLVQVGDQLDRGDDEPEILNLLERLSVEATKSGGAVHILNGNHELMNAVGDLRYVTEDGMRDFANVPVPPHVRIPPHVPPQVRGRLMAFAPGSPLARKLAERNTVTIVGDTVFAHAGVLTRHVEYGIERINDEVRRFLLGESPQLPDVVAREDAPVWTRLYGGPNPGSDACRELDSVLTALKVKRMVVGHTVQPNGVTSACDGKVYRVDVGLSDYYGVDNPTQVLEITSGGVRVLSANDG